MPYDKNSFLQGIALGRAMKGADAVLPAASQIIFGTCIDGDISLGKPVGMFYNGGDSLERVGDVPGYTNRFWTDDNGQFYTVQSGKLVVKDGISGETLENTEDAYDFSVAGSKTCCAYKSSTQPNEWVVILPDGSRSIPIQIQSTNNRTPSFGYRNGIIGICVGSTGSWSGVDTYTYDAAGQYLHTLQKGGELGAEAKLVLPISESAVGYARDSLSMYVNNRVCAYAIAAVSGYSSYDVWSGYSVSYQGSSNIWLGADRSYSYVSARNYNGEAGQWTDQYYTGRFSIDNYDGLELLRTEQNGQAPYGNSADNPSASSQGTITHTTVIGSETERTLLDLVAMETVYDDALSDIPSNPIIQENNGYIWISGMGVYHKTPKGWLIYPTSTYPKQSPWNKLGYALDGMAVGGKGRAAVMFE